MASTRKRPKRRRAKECEGCGARYYKRTKYTGYCKHCCAAHDEDMRS